ncbi:hypothetical protein EYF80_047637 [Liparis tanakae]|uniref:Uncharacterized protein n=1 Tax=Liparis tanakae TaxID=230148 RepID=A0A4Z2FMG3_9TELE|nr:hypothetical protein EYF80_047637 [Liparis tanakae]
MPITELDEPEDACCLTGAFLDLGAAASAGSDFQLLLSFGYRDEVTLVLTPLLCQRPEDALRRRSDGIQTAFVSFSRVVERPAEQPGGRGRLTALKGIGVLLCE